MIEGNSSLRPVIDGKEVKSNFLGHSQPWFLNTRGVYKPRLPLHECTIEHIETRAISRCIWLYQSRQ